MVTAEEAYSEVLQLEFEPREEEDEQPPVLQVATPNPVLDAAIMKTKDKHSEGDAPPHFADQTSYSSHASSSLCLDNQEQYSRITHYMIPGMGMTVCLLPLMVPACSLPGGELFQPLLSIGTSISEGSSS